MADGLFMLQAIDVSDCLFYNTLDMKLANALYNIDNDLVDMQWWDELTEYKTPMDLYRWLVSNKPPEELCFAHDDYTPENIFTADRELTCIIDVGDCGIADKWKDIALCVRSINIHCVPERSPAAKPVFPQEKLLSGYTRQEEQNKHVELLFYYLGFEPDWTKIKYYTLLDELF